MAIVIALFGFNDLGRSVTPIFFQKRTLFTIISTLSKNEQKINQSGTRNLDRWIASPTRVADNFATPPLRSHLCC